MKENSQNGKKSIKGKILTFVLIFSLIFFLQWLQAWRLDQRKQQMNEMLIDKGIMASDGTLNPRYSGE